MDPPTVEGKAAANPPSTNNRLNNNRLKNRLPRRQRAENPPPIQLTGRDVQVIEAVHAHRVLRRDQVQALYFPSVRTVQRALARLFHHGYLVRRFLPTVYGGLRQAMYLLDQRGADLIASRSGLDRDEIAWGPDHNLVGDLFLEHTLAVNQVRIAIQLAVEQRGWRVERWLDEGQLQSRGMKDTVEVSWRDDRGVSRRRRQAVVADGYFLLDLGQRAHFFLELDQGTVSNRRWAGKVRAYQAYWESGGYQARYRTTSLRILTVTTGEERLGNLKGTTEGAGGGQTFWFTTMERVTPEAVLTGAIWQMAGAEGLHPLTG